MCEHKPLYYEYSCPCDTDPKPRNNFCQSTSKTPDRGGGQGRERTFWVETVLEETCVDSCDLWCGWKVKCCITNPILNVSLWGKLIGLWKRFVLKYCALHGSTLSGRLCYFDLPFRKSFSESLCPLGMTVTWMFILHWAKPRDGFLLQGVWACSVSEGWCSQES